MAGAAAVAAVAAAADRTGTDAEARR